MTLRRDPMTIRALVRWYDYVKTKDRVADIPDR
jgi:hypothetical protein